MSSRFPYLHTILVAITLLSYEASTHARTSEFEEPFYGIESTITNGTLSELCCDRSGETFKRLANSAHDLNGAELRRRYETAFPRQMDVFDRFARAFFAGERLPPVEAHSDMPAYTRALGQRGWLRIQFEAQAIELHAPRATISTYLRDLAPEIDARFFEVGQQSGFGLRPHRDWGMGHLHEEQAPAGQSPDALALRNRVVGEFNDEYFWDFMGPNIEADIHWDAYPKNMAIFKEWLTRFDRWLETSIETDEGRKRLAFEMLDDLLLHPLFKHLPRRFVNDLGPGLFVLRDGFLSLGNHARVAERALMRIILGQMFRYAVSGITSGRHGSAVQLKIPESTDSLTLEFRRIPAHRDADEAARWMNLLRGRRRRADAATLIPLVTPRPPRTDREKLDVFERYCASANAHPRDYARFLPARLAWRAPLMKSDAPRWSEVRQRLLCEDAIAH